MKKRKRQQKKRQQFKERMWGYGKNNQSKLFNKSRFGAFADKAALSHGRKSVLSDHSERDVAG